jgi:signal transduction histidine kinase
VQSGHERFETRHRHRDGHWIDLEITVTGMDQLYLVAFLRDISERKAADLVLRELMRAADAANQAKRDFLVKVSHEFRTSMNGIVGPTNLLLETPLDADQRECLTLVQDSAKSLMATLNNMLDFPRMEAEKRGLAAIPSPVNSLPVEQHPAQ